MTEKTVLITGANRGIGLALAKAYAAQKDRVIATCRNPEQAEELQALARTHLLLTIKKLDVTDWSGHKNLLKELGEAPLDLLINNAGVFSGASESFNATTADPSQSFGTIERETWMNVLRTNTIAPVMLTQALFPLLERGEDKKIIMISSTMGSISAMNESGDMAYRTSKAALNGAMKNIALHLQLKNYTVASLHPGWVKTRMGTEAARLTVQESAAQMLHTISTLTFRQTGGFFDYDGKVLPW